ncbi:MAG: hypothetical protein WCP21_18150, partial [Armatimonadota bacterium]
PLTFCLPALLLGALVFAQQPSAQSSPFAQGGVFYQQGDYQRAQQAYLQQLQQGPVTGPLLYNLGNSCFQSQQLGWAILYYERAKLAIPRDRDLRANLAVALGIRRLPPATEAPGWAQVLWGGVLDRVTLNELTLLALVSYLATCALLIWALRSEHLRRRYQWLLVAGAVIFVVLGSLTASKWRQYHDPARAVIVADGQLLSGPANSFQALRRTYQGELAHVRSQQGMWREVRCEAGAVGWVTQSEVELIAPPGG